MSEVNKSRHVPPAYWYNDKSVPLHAGWLASIYAALIGLRYWRRRNFLRAVAMPRIGVDELRALMRAGREPLIVDVASAPKDVPLRAHAGEEFNYVIEGRCRLLFGAQEYVLEAGDSVYFDASVEHAVHAIDRQPCRLLAVVSSRDFQFHRHIGKVVEGRIQA